MFYTILVADLFKANIVLDSRLLQLKQCLFPQLTRVRHRDRVEQMFRLDPGPLL